PRPTPGCGPTFTIRAWSPRTVSRWESAPAVSQCRHLPSLLRRLAKLSGDARPDGRQPACAWSDVARGRNPSPPHDRMAFASSILPFPHIYRLALRLAFPRGRRTGLPCSVSVTAEWVRRALSTGSVAAHDKEARSPCTRYSAVLAQACQHLWLVFCDDV